MPLLERRGSSAVSGKGRGEDCQACSSVKGSSGPCILPGRGAHETERSSRDDWYRDRISIQLTLIEVKKFSNLDDTDRPCWIPALAVRRDTRVRSPRHGWYAHAPYVRYRCRGGPTPRPIGIASLLASVLQAASAFPTGNKSPARRHRRDKN